MTARVALKRPSGFLPVAMSLAALAILGFYLMAYGPAPQADEGTAAHLYQALLAGQAPLVLYFAFRWVRESPREALPVLALQLGAALVALAPVLLLGW